MQKIAVVGVGKLGICFALNAERAGFDVVGVDISESYVAALNQKKIETHEPLVAEYLAESKNFFATTDLKTIVSDEINLIFLMVATPSQKDGSYDHSQIERVITELLSFGKRFSVVDIAIGCTVMPGYCNELNERVKPFNYRVSYNPEFIAQGAIIHGQQQPDQVLIGEAETEAGDKIENIHKAICKNQPAICRMDNLSAEIAKIATNCFLTTKISFANSVGDLATKVGADPEKILAAIGADSRIGKKYLNYGFGFGGPCFPRDNRALNLFARQSNHELLISAATDEINKQHLEFQFQHYLKSFEKNEVIVFDYITYKKDSIILEESQQLALAVKLAKAGRKVLVKERGVVINALQKDYPGLFQLQVID